MKHAYIATVFGVICGLEAGSALAQGAPPTPKWLTHPKEDYLIASRLKGLEVYNNAGQDIGDIDEVLIDRSGTAQAVVLSVGGFLGVADRHVAVPFDQFSFVHRSRLPVAATNSGETAPPRPAQPNAAATAGGATGTVARSDALGSLSLSPVPTGVPPELAGNNSNVPDRALINLSAEQLRAAPIFLYKP